MKPLRWRRAIRELSSKMPLWCFALVAISVSVLVIALSLILLPFWILYASALCCVSWFVWTKPGRDTIVVLSDATSSGEWTSRILALVDGRAVFLDYDERKQWDRWSLTVQLYYCFRPQPIPEFFMPKYLPAVIVFHRFRRPQKFTFGTLARDHQTKMQELASCLVAEVGEDSRTG
jgi:hypothetical protein